MRERLIITDIAAVDAGVSIVGYVAGTTRAIRPVPPSGGGIPWSTLRDDEGLPIEPFTEVELELAEPCPSPPHCEDQWLVDGGQFSIIRRCGPTEQRELLQQTIAGSVAAIFETEIIRRRFTRPGAGLASTGTIRVREIGFLNLDADTQLRRDRYDLEFRDENDVRYSLRTTDLAFREHCRRARDRFTGRRDLAAVRVRERLNQTDEIYLRVGLSRPFPAHTQDNARCYLIVTGIYTFPSYFDGRWADFYPTPKRRAAEQDQRAAPAEAAP